ncbi:MAG: tetratricopeptide repeat protein [Sphingobacteriia bacterium]|nr:tetratricopeptide repeat protein [Sphingobacteriia bacterium]
MKNSKPKSKATSFSPSPLWIWIAILLITFIGYSAALKNGFTNWDDDTYVIDNPLLKNPSWQSVFAMFSSPYYLLYTPFTILSFAINYWFMGKDAFPIIFTNILIHAVNAVLCGILSYRLSGKLGVGFIAGILFGLHPQHVESVAWISERKDVLFTFFILGGMCHWAQNPSENKPQFILINTLWMLAACLSKPTAVIYPALLLGIDYLNNKPISVKLILEKIPLGILSLFFGWLLLYGVDTQGGQTHDTGDTSHSFTGIDTVLIAIYSFVWYPIKMIFPWPLNAFYAYPFNHEPLPLFYMLSPVLAVFMIGSVIYGFWKKWKFYVFAWLIYMVGIFLFIKVLTTVGAVTYDRYFYVASIGFCVGAGFLFWKFLQIPSLKIITGIILLIFISGYAWAVNQRCKVWKNSYTLMSDMIEGNPNKVPFAYNNRGLWLTEQGRTEEALSDFQNSIRLDPKSPKAWLNAGKLLGQNNQIDSAIYYLENAQKLEPHDSKVYNNLGNAYGMKGNWNAAISSFTEALKFEPNNVNALFNLGITHGLAGDTVRADSLLRLSARQGFVPAQQSLQSRGKPW